MRYSFLIAFVLLFSAPLVAQYIPTPVDISTEKIKIKGQVFYIHGVLKGQTLYSIAKRYGVSVADIQKHNPQLEAMGLQEGEHLQIPVIGAKIEPETPPTTPVSLLPETVTPAALIESTANTPDTSVLPCTYHAAPVDINRCESYAYNPAEKRFHMALLLPFGGEYITKEMAFDTLLDHASARLRSSDNFVEFYAGALMAAERMKDKGLALDISVHDIYEASDLERTLRNRSLEKVDLIVGPVYVSSVQQVLEFINQHKINLVSPLDPKVESLLLENPTLFQVQPSVDCQQVKLLEGMDPENDNVLLVYDISGEESSLLESYQHLMSGFKNLTTFSYKVEKGVAVRDTLMKLLIPDKENRVIIASNNEALVSDFTSNLSYVHSKLKFPLTLYGQARWRNFENVDLSFFHAMNLHLVTPFYVDYKDTGVREFVLAYRAQFNAEPTQFAFQGYDVVKYFLTALHRYGPKFGECIPLLQTKLLQGNYHFQRVSPNGGFINTNPALIRYTPDYTIVKE